MTTSDLVAALKPVTECLQSLGVRFYVTGSLPSSAHGIARSSLDVDLVAKLELQHVDELTGCLGSAYYVPHDHVRSAVEQRRSFNLIHLATMFKVDIFISRRRAFDDQAAERAHPELFDDAGHLRLPIATPEDTVLAKLEWFRRGGETSDGPWQDIVGVPKVARGGDRGHLRKWAAALDVSDLLERALNEADASR